MSKISHQVKVYNMLKEANGPVTVEQLLTIEGLLAYKLSAYVLYARNDYNAVIKPIREGRKVVAYEMTDAGNDVRKTKTTAVAAKPAKTVKPTKVVTKVAKAPKTPKVVAPVVAAPEPTVMKNDKIVDILDEMDTNVASFEDREFATEYVRSL